MAARDVLKNIALFVDGRGYAGQVEEFTPPKLTLKTEEYRAGGMDGSLEVVMGMDKMTSEFSLKGYDRNALALWGVKQGQTFPVTMIGALESEDGTVVQIKHNLRGKFTEIDQGNYKPGEMSALKMTMAVNYYKMTHGGIVVHEIDVERMIRTIDGVDALAGIRAALNM